MAKDVTDSLLPTIEQTIPKWNYNPESVIFLTDKEKSLYEEHVKSESLPFENHIVTIDSYKKDQDVLTYLNNEDKAVNAARLQLERAYMKPITDLKDWLKVANEPRNKARANLTVQIKEFKQRDKDLRLSTVKGVFEKLADASELDLHLFEEYFKDFLKVSDFKTNTYELKPITIKKINDVFDKVQAEQDLLKENIELIKESAADAELISSSYITLFERGASLADVLKQIKEDKKAVETEKALIEERKAVQEKAEQERKAEIERLAAENAEARFGILDTETGEILDSRQIGQEPEKDVTEAQNGANFDDFDVSLVYNLKITCPNGIDQAKKLSQFMKDNGIIAEEIKEIEVENDK